MKTSYFWVLVVVIAIVVLASVSMKNRSAPETASTSGTVSNVPAAGTNPAKTPAVKNSVSPTAPVGTTLKAYAVMLPIYYAQQIASTTLEIHVSNPSSNTISASPLAVTGEARGSWFFEGSFPIVLTNLDGGVIAQGHVTAQSNWMTSEFVPFSASLAFPKQKSGTKGYLVLRKDNPSGLAKNDAAVKMAITF